MENAILTLSIQKPQNRQPILLLSFDQAVSAGEELELDHDEAQNVLNLIKNAIGAMDDIRDPTLDPSIFTP